jgi:predicted hydrocarbon binding protein
LEAAQDLTTVHRLFMKFVDAGMCAELRGYIQGIISVGSGRDIRMQHTVCRMDGAEACVFEGTWR